MYVTGSRIWRKRLSSFSCRLGFRLVQYIANTIRELDRRERFGDERHAPVEPRTKRLLIRIPREIQKGQVGAKAADLLDELRAIHFRHDEVDQHQVDVNIGPDLEQTQRFFTAGGYQNAVAVTRQHHLRETQNCELIVYYQDNFGSRLGRHIVLIVALWSGPPAGNAGSRGGMSSETKTRRLESHRCRPEACSTWPRSTCYDRKT